MTRAQLLEERWELAHSFGHGQVSDGKARDRIAEIDRILDLNNKFLVTFDQAQAIREGWCLMYSTGRGAIEIQRDDNQYTFTRDEDATAHVCKCAEAGSLFHQQALAIIEKQVMWPE